ncbi:MAG: DsbA family protein [Rubrimonas sp.]
MRPSLPTAAALALTLSAALAVPPVSAQPAADEIDARIRAYLLDNPEVILEALEVLEQRRADAQARADEDLVAANEQALFADGRSHVFGNPDGDVTIVEFADYRCGYCKQAHPTVQALLEADPNLRLVYKEFPILGPDSVLASRAAMAALAIDPEAYERLNDAMLSWRAALDEDAIFALAGEAGLDEGELRARMDDPAIAETLRANYALAQSLRIEGTPSFVVGNRIVRGYVGLDQMQMLVAQARDEDG